MNHNGTRMYDVMTNACNQLVSHEAREQSGKEAEWKERTWPTRYHHIQRERRSYP
jgi:hypothetical protein